MCDVVTVYVVKEENIRTLIHIVGTDLFYLERISSAFTTPSVNNLLNLCLKSLIQARGT